jgi:hypothetical protein
MAIRLEASVSNPRQQFRNVVGFMEREMNLEQMQAFIDAVDQPELSGQDMDRAHAAVGKTATAVGDLVVKIGGGEHRAFHPAEVVFVETAFDASLGIGQLGSYLGFHSKSSRVPGEQGVA